MMTIFTVPRPFKGEFDIIQRNGIKSWTLLEPKCEIILFGNEEGAAKAATELGVKHIAELEINEFGTPMLEDMLAKAKKFASNGILVPFQPDQFSRKGLNHFHQVLQDVDEMEITETPEIIGYIPNLVENNMREINIFLCKLCFCLLFFVKVIYKKVNSLRMQSINHLNKNIFYLKRIIPCHRVMRPCHPD